MSSPNRCPRSRPKAGIAVCGRGGSCRGFSLLEILIALTVMTIALGATTTTLVASTSLSHANRETALAVDAARSALESVKGEVFAAAFVSFNDDPADDPGAAGTAPGKYFAVWGLGLRQGDPDGFVGEIIFPGDGVALHEDYVDREMGMPRDLNGDLVIDVGGVDHAGDYNVLPVKVRIEWTGKSGDRELEFVTVVTEF